MAVKLSVDGKIVSSETGGASLPVQLSGSSAESLQQGGSGISRYLSTATAVDNSATETLLDIQDAVVVEVLEMSANNKGVVFMFEPYTSSGESAGRYVPMDTDGAGVSQLSAEGINAKSSSIFTLLHYDEDTNRYKLALSRPLVCPAGFILKADNNTGGSVSVNFFAYVRTL